MLMSVNTHHPLRSHCYVHTIDVLKHTCIPFTLFTSSRARADMFWHTHVHTCIHTHTNTILHSRRQVTLSTYMNTYTHTYGPARLVLPKHLTLFAYQCTYTDLTRIHTWTCRSCFARTLRTLSSSRWQSFGEHNLTKRTHIQKTLARARTHTHTDAVIVFFHEDD